MNWRDMPPLAALRAFCAFSQSGNVVRAGDTLNVSHAAISQQLKALERFLGVALVDRRGRALELTTEGKHLARAVELGFGSMAGAIAELTDLSADRPLQISTTPMFASNWLMPRLGGFQTQASGIDLMINPSVALTDPEPGGIDVAIRFGNGKWPGLNAELLVATDIVVSAAPSLVGNREFDAPAELLDYPWLQEIGTNEAQDWLQAHGVTQSRVRNMIQLPGNLVLDGARSGRGIFITPKSLVEDEVSSGRLRVLFRDAGESGYFIVTGAGVLRPPAQQFVTWLRRQK